MKLPPHALLMPSVLLLGLLGWAQACSCAPARASRPGPQAYTAQWRSLVATPGRGLASRPARRLTGAARPLLREPLRNIAGWDAPQYRPTNRSTRLAVSPDGRRVAIVWLHNGGASDDPYGEPVTYATSGDPADPASFTPPQQLAARPFKDRLALPTPRRKYNSAHNAPFVLARGDAGFLSLSLPLNANGYAQMLPPTGFGYVLSQQAAGDESWSAPALAPLDGVALGSSLSELSGGMDRLGSLHLFGQIHLGSFNGAFGYQRREAGSSVWQTFSLADAYRPQGLHYFLEGAGFVAPGLNALGHNDLHAAFAYNRQGTAPMYGLYYLESHDGGDHWVDGENRPVATPLDDSRNTAAVFEARLGESGYDGAEPGPRGISLCASDSGQPLIVRLHTLSNRPQQAQAKLYTHVGAAWLSVPVGQPMFWNQGGTAIAYNARSGRVNVLLLDPGGAGVPARVLLYHEPLAQLSRGIAAWSEEVAAVLPNRHGYASSLQAVAVADTRFEVLVEPDYRNPGQVSPVLLEAPMR